MGDSKQILLGPSLHAVPACLLLLGRQPRQEQVPQCYSGSNGNDLLRIHQCLKSEPFLLEKRTGGGTLLWLGGMYEADTQAVHG